MISTASQMWELFHVMPLLIGAEIAPDDQQYQCFLLLQDVASIVFTYHCSGADSPFTINDPRVP